MHPLAPYPSPDEREAELDRAAHAAGGEVVVYGASCEGRPLRIARLPALAPSRRQVLCTAGIHGPELIAAHTALALLRSASDGGSEAYRLRQQAELWVAPCLNPDGYHATWVSEGDAPLSRLRPNAHGVDLNRNFPAPRGRHYTSLPWAGSSHPQSVNYRGPAPLSEPETDALHRLLTQQRFHAAVGLHSFMGRVIPARVTDRKDYAAYSELARCFRRAQIGQRYGRLASRWFDVYTGELEDHLHHNLRCWGVCVEIMTIRFSYGQHLRAPRLFWRFNPHDPDPWVRSDVPAAVALLQAALQLPHPGFD